MSHWLQVGVGSGGMVVLDLLCRDPRLQAVTLIEPDTYQPHNAVRHYFPAAQSGQTKLNLAAEWVRAHRPDLRLTLLPLDLLAAEAQSTLAAAAAEVDFGVCAVDNESAKFHWDALMRRYRLRWTLGEVLSGGIGGFVHRFTPDGPCYGCVATFLKRETTVEKPAVPDYSQPGGPVVETTIPASAASIHAIASLQAIATLELLDRPLEPGRDWTSMLLTLKEVPEVFPHDFRSHRFVVPRQMGCLVCQPPPAALAAEELDGKLAEALERLGDSQPI